MFLKLIVFEIISMGFINFIENQMLLNVSKNLEYQLYKKKAFKKAFKNRFDFKIIYKKRVKFL